MGKLGIQLDPIHWSKEFRDAIKAMQPNSIRMINGSASRMWELRELAPQTLFTIRQHELSEDHKSVWADPAGTGIAHARTYAKLVKEWGVHRDERVNVVGANEISVWRPGGVKVAVEYNLAFLKVLTDEGIRGIALSLNTGFPEPYGPEKGSRPNWEPYAALLTYIKENQQHSLGLHEYMGAKGPEVTADLKPHMAGGPWGWLCGRYVWLDPKKWPIPIIIGEVGMNASVDAGKGDLPQNQQGWKNWLKTPRQYAEYMLAYDKAIERDPRIISAQWFLLDGDSKHWSSTFYRECMEFIPRNTEFKAYADIPKPPSTDEKPPPPVEVPTPEDSPLYRALRAVGRNAQLIMLNRDAALQKEIFRDGLVPVANEFVAAYEGKNYVVQRAEDLSSGVGYTYFAVVNAWDKVTRIRD